ncbi:hypothetical protein [Streptomyces fodineus]|uniref:hypothetical protein n=1 Tax=Streptomyces fodineus TaxID=1904616 RepID=UPI00131BF75A|nr:hypothetical protein [Streptomyces fodineus]
MTSVGGDRAVGARAGGRRGACWTKRPGSSHPLGRMPYVGAFRSKAVNTGDYALSEAP